MKNPNKKLSFELNKTTIIFQKNIIDRLRLYDFAKSAIVSYCVNKATDFTGHDFKDFKRNFKLIRFKSDKEIESISSKDIINVGNDFIENELGDSVFVMNMSTFEHWILKILKHRFMENPKELFDYSDRKIDILMLKDVNNLDELWERIIDDYLKSLPYSGMKKTLKFFLKKFKISESKTTQNIIEKIHENSSCRNLIVHNQKKVNKIYVKNCGRFAKFREGDIVKVAEDILFEEGDNLLRFMQDFRSNI